MIFWDFLIININDVQILTSFDDTAKIKKKMWEIYYQTSLMCTSNSMLTGKEFVLNYFQKLIKAFQTLK